MILGADFSHWSGKVDMQKAKAGGIVFVYNKATEGVNYLDSTFRSNHANAKTAGVYRGAYHFLRWNADPVQQAEYFWSVIKDDPGELPPCCDYETNPGVGTPSTALKILERFVTRLEELSGRVPMIYTGWGFWKYYGSEDPKWARYPLWYCWIDPGEPAKLKPWDEWTIQQYSWVGNGPDYGAQEKGVDLNKTTIKKLSAIMAGATIPPEVEEPIMANALGLYTQVPRWGGDFGFIAGYAGKGLTLNGELKAIEEKAVTEKRAFFLWYKFDSTYYSENQIMAQADKWPAPADDQPFQKLVTALVNRAYQGVVIEVMDLHDAYGKAEDPGYYSTAANWFCERVAQWLEQNRPGVKFMVASSNAFIEANAPHINDWIGKFNSCAVQQTTAPLVNGGWPADGEKPQYLDNRFTCEFWRFHEMGAMALIIYRMGDRTALNKWLGYDQPAQPPVEPPVEKDDLTKLTARVSVAEAEIAAIKAKMDKARVTYE